MSERRRYSPKREIALTDAERSAIEIADFGLSKLEETGLEIVVYVNTERVAAKELAMFPRQICPEHRHPPFDGTPGKEETFAAVRARSTSTRKGSPRRTRTPGFPATGRSPHGTKSCCGLGNSLTVPLGLLRWFQAGDEGAIVSEFSTHSRDDLDIFTDPRIERATRLADG